MIAAATFGFCSTQATRELGHGQAELVGDRLAAAAPRVEHVVAS